MSPSFGGIEERFFSVRLEFLFLFFFKGHSRASELTEELPLVVCTAILL